MNPLLSRSNAQSRQQRPDLMGFISQTNPQQARRQVEQMLQDGRITQDQLSQLFDQARQIGKSLGLK